MVDFTVFKGSKEGKIVKATTTREIGPNDVLVKITHSVRNDPSPLHPISMQFQMQQSTIPKVARICNQRIHGC